MIPTYIYIFSSFSLFLFMFINNICHTMTIDLNAIYYKYRYTKIYAEFICQLYLPFSFKIRAHKNCKVQKSIQKLRNWKIFFRKCLSFIQRFKSIFGCVFILKNNWDIVIEISKVSQILKYKSDFCYADAFVISNIYEPI